MAALDTLCPAARKVILALRAHGLSYDCIAAELNRRGMKGAVGGRWFGGSVFRVVRAAAAASDQPIAGAGHDT